MKSDINLQDLWKGQKSAVPDINTILQVASGLKKAHLKKLIIINIMLIGTSLFIIYIWMNYNAKYWSTPAGIILVLLAMAVYLLAYNRNYSVLKVRPQNAREHLEQLIKLQKRQQFMQTTMLNLYYILLSAGFALYMIEFVLRMTLFWGIMAYVITGAWILFAWFYIRPKRIRKQNEQMDSVLSKLKDLVSQMKESGDDSK